jgi:protein-tyrosine phosphatase
MQKITSEPKVKRVEGKQHSTRFDLIPPNTNYTVRVSGVTRSRHHGEEATRHCSMPPTIPDKDKLARFSWRKVEEQGRWLFRLLLPRVTERNGPICCYRYHTVSVMTYHLKEKRDQLKNENRMEHVSQHFNKYM